MEANYVTVDGAGRLFLNKREVDYASLFLPMPQMPIVSSVRCAALAFLQGGVVSLSRPRRKGGQ